MPDYSRYEFIKVEKAERVATVTLNRPDRLNAVNPGLHHELMTIWNDLAEDREVNAIILTGALGALAAVGFALALNGAGARIADATGLHETDLAAKYALLAFLVVISAAAGALRYLMERLNVEAEALEYRDARDRFERAERRLARGSDPATGVPADVPAAACTWLVTDPAAADPNGRTVYAPDVCRELGLLPGWPPD